METFVTSLIALALGFVAGGLVDLSAALRPVTPLNSFALVFLAAAAGSAAQAVLAAGMDEPGSLGLWETARNVLDTDTLRTWRAVSALESTENPVKKQTVLYSLGYSRAPAAAGEIRRIMAEPLSREKGELIDALFHTRRPELEGDLRKEAADRWAYHRVRAVFALGAYPGEENEALLARLLDDGEPLVRSAAAKSLARLGAESCREKVTAMAKGAVSVLERLDYLIALFHYDAERAFLSDLFSPATAALGESLEKPLHSLLARLFGMTPPLAALYREEALRPGGGLEILLEEARETAFLLDRGDRVAAAWAAGDFPAVWGICRTALAWAEPPGDLAPLGRAIAAFPPGSASRINALAALYYTYQILTAQEAS